MLVAFFIFILLGWLFPRWLHCRAGILNPKHRAGQLHSTVHLLVVCEWERLEHVISAWQRFGVVLNQSVQI